MEKRVYNFSSGPAMLPLPVLEEAQRDLVCLPGVGSSILEISHRSKEFEAILDNTEANLRKLLGIPDNYKVLFLQGGSRLQFTMVPKNLMKAGESADFVVTGSWSKMALEEAQREGTVRAAYNGKATNFDRLPDAKQIEIDPKAAFAYICSNETIQGVQFATEPDVGNVPLVCDSSSDFLHRPLDMKKYGLLYACAQKNAGPAGVTVVIIRDDLLERSSDSLPTMLNYQAYAKEKSMPNTPPTFAIYIVNLVTKWLLNDIGGLAKMHELNRQKAKLLYDVIDSSDGFYRGHAQPNSRSLMNVTFRLADESLDKEFVAQSEKRGLTNLKGHRSVGGMRASIYNAMPIAGIEALAQFMGEFKKR